MVKQSLGSHDTGICIIITISFLFFFTFFYCLNSIIQKIQRTA